MNFFRCKTKLRDVFTRISDHRYKLEVFFSLSAVFLSYVNRWNLYKRFESELSTLMLFRVDQMSWNELLSSFHILADMIFEQKMIGIQDHHSELIQRVNWFVENHLSNDISLTSIAEFAGHSPSYLSRLYKQITNNSLSSFIKETRLSRAKGLLEKNQLRINDISEAVGFVSEPSFYRFFKKETGRTPQEYRDQPRSTES